MLVQSNSAGSHFPGCIESIRIVRKRTHLLLALLPKGTDWLMCQKDSQVNGFQGWFDSVAQWC